MSVPSLHTESTDSVILSRVHAVLAVKRYFMHCNQGTPSNWLHGPGAESEGSIVAHNAPVVRK